MLLIMIMIMITLWLWLLLLLNVIFTIVTVPFFAIFTLTILVSRAAARRIEGYSVLSAQNCMENMRF